MMSRMSQTPGEQSSEKVLETNEGPGVLPEPPETSTPRASREASRQSSPQSSLSSQGLLLRLGLVPSSAGPLGLPRPFLESSKVLRGGAGGPKSRGGRSPPAGGPP